MDFQPVSLGLLPDEVVIRGGLLPKPMIVSNVKVVAGAPYLVLIKSSAVLCQFLAGRSSCKRPLVKTMVFETLLEARNTKFKELIEEARGAAGDLGPGEGEVAEFEDKLGLDVAVPSPAKGKRKVAISRLVAQVPAAAKVSMLGGEWCPMMLLEGSTKAPAIEATPDNLRRLFDMAQAEMEDGVIKRARHGSGGEDRPKPRGPLARRDIVLRLRWVGHTASLRTKSKDFLPSQVIGVLNHEGRQLRPQISEGRRSSAEAVEKSHGINAAVPRVIGQLQSKASLPSGNNGRAACGCSSNSPGDGDSNHEMVHRPGVDPSRKQDPFCG
jgi:hypothetical protein